MMPRHDHLTGDLTGELAGVDGRYRGQFPHGRCAESLSASDQDVSPARGRVAVPVTRVCTVPGPALRARSRLERQTDSTSSYARRRPALPDGLEWRVEGLVPAGRTADVKPGRSVLGAESAGCVRPGSDNALTGDSRTLGRG